jgi:hypothetical protein
MRLFCKFQNQNQEAGDQGGSECLCSGIGGGGGCGGAGILYELSLRLNYMIHNPSWRQLSLRHTMLIFFKNEP